jgi:hypothetical protein
MTYGVMVALKKKQSVDWKRFNQQNNIHNNGPKVA